MNNIYEVKTLKKSVKRIIAAALFAASILTFAACQGGGNNPAGTTGGSKQTNTTDPADTEFIQDEIPAGTDLGGVTVTMFWWQDGTDGEFVNEGDGDGVDEAKYLRDAAVEERLKVKLRHIGKSYTWDTQGAYLDTIRASVKSGDATYDIVSGQYAIMPALIIEGIYTDLIPLSKNSDGSNYLDFDKPWWLNDIVKQTSVDGKMYLATGSITPMSIMQMFCIYGNEKLINDKKLENPCDIALRGEWTLDKLAELTTNEWDDVDRDGTQSTGDYFGMVYPGSNYFKAYESALGIQMTTVNDDGTFEIACMNEKFNNCMDKLMQYINSAGWVKGPDGGPEYDIIYNSRALFWAGTFGDAAGRGLRDFSDGFYILPYPKYTADQEEYYTKLGEVNNLFGITSNSKNTIAAAAVMECMASEGYRKVDQAFYEEGLKKKYNVADQSAQMFDLIRNGMRFDFGSLYGTALDFPFCTIKGYIYSDTATSWASFCSRRVEKAQEILNDFYNAVKNLDT